MASQYDRALAVSIFVFLSKTSALKKGGMGFSIPASEKLN